MQRNAGSWEEERINCLFGSRRALTHILQPRINALLAPSILNYRNQLQNLTFLQIYLKEMEGSRIDSDIFLNTIWKPFRLFLAHTICHVTQDIFESEY